MTHSRLFGLPCVVALLASAPMLWSEEALPPLSSMQAIVSVADQKIAVLRDGQVIAKYPISTSRFGVGDRANSYKTPLGTLKVCEKLGDRLPEGAVIKHRRATGEVISVNAPGRDPIVTRILWLDGTEPQNEHAKERSIYIHGTPEEKLIGRPASYGCIRMRSKDVVSLYEDLAVGSAISIIPDKLPHLAKYQPPSPREIAKAEASAAAARAEKEREEAKVEPPAPQLVAKAPEPVRAAPETAITPAARVALAAAREANEKESREARSASVKPVKMPAALPTPAPKVIAAVAPKEPEKKTEVPSHAAAKTVTSASISAPKIVAATPEKEKTRPEAAVVSAPRLTVKAAPAPLASIEVNEPARLVKVEPVPSPKSAALPKAEGSPAKAPAPIAALGQEKRTATRGRSLEARPPAVATPVDPDRLAFIKSHEANLAAARATPEMINRTESSSSTPTTDLSSRMKGSILDTGLTR